MVKRFLWCITEEDSSGTIRAFQVCLLLYISPQLGMPEDPLIKLTDQSYRTNRNDSTSWCAPEIQRQERSSDGQVREKEEGAFRNSSRFQCNVMTLMMHISKY